MFDHVKHFNSELAGKTVSWLGEDNKENFQRHLDNPVKQQQLIQSGWTQNNIEYNFNQHGFRSKEFNLTHQHICVFGCSMTFGIGINQSQRYGELLAQDLGVACYNFGVSGGSDSTSFRLALTWLPKLQPHLVVYQKTFPERFEVIDQGHGKIIGINAALGGDVPQMSGNLHKIWMVNEENSQLLAEKNLMAMQTLCQQLDVTLLTVDYQDFFGKWDTWARDLHHPGSQANIKVFNQLRQQL